MGKKSGMTKSGRVMNPADRERKQLRLKELKRNKKQRNLVRTAIVKGRDAEELIEHLERLDDQEFDQNCELSANVIADKRAKFRSAFFAQLTLYRNEKNDKKAKDLEAMLAKYEQTRLQKEQHFRALKFAETADPDEIPLPSGMSAPNAAMTPYMPAPPVPPQFHPTMKSSILKKAAPAAKKVHKHPPGPPCGPPPSLTDDEDEDEVVDRRRKVRFAGGGDGGYDEEDDDFAPVEIPDSMLAPQRHAVPQPRPLQPLMSSAPPIPPSMVPPPPGVIPPYGSFRLPPQEVVVPPPYGGAQRARSAISREEAAPTTAAVISAAPQVSKPTADLPPAAVISAAPELRNLKREATRFVPTALRVQRNPVMTTSHKPIGPNLTGIGIPSRPAPPRAKPAAQPMKSADEACEEFLREIQDLL